MTDKRSTPRSVSRLLSERDRGAAAHATAPSLEGGIKAFLDKLGEAAQALAESGSVKQGGELPFNIGGKQGRAVFGYTLRMGLNGMRAEPFGDAVPAPRSAKGAAQSAAARAPIVDIFEEGDEFRIVAELPGVAAPEAVTTLDGTKLLIETQGAVRYSKTIELPSAVDAASLRQSCHNGILEVRLRRAGTP